MYATNNQSGKGNGVWSWHDGTGWWQPQIHGGLLGVEAKIFLALSFPGCVPHSDVTVYNFYKVMGTTTRHNPNTFPIHVSRVRKCVVPL